MSEVRVKSRLGHRVPVEKYIIVRQGSKGWDSSSHRTHCSESSEGVPYVTGCWDNCSEVVIRLQGATAMNFGSLVSILGYGARDRSGKAFLRA